MGLSPAQTALRAGVSVNKAAVRLAESAPRLDLEATARALHAAEAAAGEWKDAADALRSHAYGLLVEAGQQWAQDGVRFDGLPPIKCSLTGATTTWDGPRAASLIAARVADQAVNRETGEVVPIGALCQMVADELDACMGFTPSKPWRKDSLRTRIGKEATERLFETTGGRETVRWVR